MRKALSRRRYESGARHTRLAGMRFKCEPASPHILSKTTTAGQISYVFSKLAEGSPMTVRIWRFHVHTLVSDMQI